MRRVVSAAFIMRHVILMLPLEGLEELVAIKLCPNENKRKNSLVHTSLKKEIRFQCSRVVDRIL